MAKFRPMSNQEEQGNIDFLVQQLRTSQDNVILKQAAERLGFLDVVIRMPSTP